MSDDDARRTPGPEARAPERRDGPEEDVPCDFCGISALQWRKCKLICTNCHNINKSCADL
jgi:hypothetical protein